jgi:hypothetical protein
MQMRAVHQCPSYGALRLRMRAHEVAHRTELTVITVVIPDCCDGRDRDVFVSRPKRRPVREPDTANCKAIV